MTTRPTTLVESDQLAQAAANVIRNEDFVPKGKRWPFSRVSKAQRDYERTVSEITARRRQVRQEALDQKLKKERSAVDAVFNAAREQAEATHRERVAEARRPFDETEAQARALRDAAIAAANQAYQQAVESANRIYMQEAGELDQQRDALVNDAKSLHDQAYAGLDAQRQADLAQIAKDLSTIALEGPMRIVEDKDAWSPEERKKALLALVDMAGREDIDAPFADLCLRNVAGYVYQDRYLRPEHQLHRLMDASLLEGLVELARRTPERRPMVVSHLYDIVQNNPGHSSPGFIKALTELYVIASADAESAYHPDTQENERIFEQMRAHIADTLKLTPRRSQVPAAPASAAQLRPPTQRTLLEEQDTPVLRRAEDITADVDVGDLLPMGRLPPPPPLPPNAESAEAEPALQPTEADASVAASDVAPPAGASETSAGSGSEPAAKSALKGDKGERAARGKRAAARVLEAAAMSGVPAEPTGSHAQTKQREESQG